MKNTQITFSVSVGVFPERINWARKDQLEMWEAPSMKSGAQMGLKEMEKGWSLGILFCSIWSTMMKTTGPITASWAQWTKVSGTRNQNKINPPHHKIFLPGIWSLQWQGMDNTENVLTN